MTDYLARNLAAFRASGLEAAAEKLDTLGALPISLTGDAASRNLNINLGSNYLYAENAFAYAEGQVARYLEKPNRFYVNLPDANRPPDTHNPLIGKEGQLYSRLSKRFPDHRAEPYDFDAGYMISFGLGLGLHLPLLLAKLNNRDLIIVEQFWAFLHLSLQILDWSPLISELSRRGGRIHLVIGSEPGQLANQIYTALRQENFGLVDGSFGFQHYNSPLLNETHRLFREMQATLGMSKGFFDDECLMLENFLANRDQAACRKFVPTPDLLKETPVFVIGSGPSVTRSIAVVKKFRKQAFIISAGTGLGVLLANDIKPHIHCEIENVPDIFDAVMRVGNRATFGDLVLIASNTVDPRLMGEFSRSISYFRDRLTISELFAKPSEILDLSGPTVSNLACRTAIALGARAIYLYGIDLGTADPSRHHAADSAYFRDADSYWQTGAGLESLTQEVRGNFRTKIYTNGSFLLARTHFNQLIASFPEVTFFNCSDGVYLEGAKALYPDAVDLACPQPADPGQLMNIFYAGLSETAAAGRIQQPLRDYEKALHAWYDAMREILSEDWSIQGMTALYDRLKPLLFAQQDIKPADAAAIACNAGSSLMMIQYGYAVVRRLPLAQRAKFMTDFTCQMTDILGLLEIKIIRIVRRHVIADNDS